MKNVLRIRGAEYLDLSNKIFKDKWTINDVPFLMRENNLDSLANTCELPLCCDEDKTKEIICLDKLSLIDRITRLISEDTLKHLNYIINPTIKNANQIADFMIVRYNKIVLVQFCYNLVSITKHTDLQESKVVFVLRQLEQTLKRYLPVDSVVKTILFPIRNEKANELEVKRVAEQIEEFYSKSTTKELMKLIQ